MCEMRTFRGNSNVEYPRGCWNNLDGHDTTATLRRSSSNSLEPGAVRRAVPLSAELPAPSPASEQPKADGKCHDTDFTERSQLCRARPAASAPVPEAR
jgi:hypothetical protein